jgi:hypothetical protein
MYGLWDFYVSKDVEYLNIFDTKEVCSHRVPNLVQIINKDYEFNFESHELWKVNLMDKYKVQAVKCNKYYQNSDLKGCKGD